MIKLLLTSIGISNQSIRDALEQLLGKPISESGRCLSQRAFTHSLVVRITHGGPSPEG